MAWLETNKNKKISKVIDLEKSFIFWFYTFTTRSVVEMSYMQNSEEAMCKYPVMRYRWKPLHG